MAAGLIAPVERLFPRAGKPILGFLAASGIGVAMGSLLALLVSEQTALFGFREYGYRQAIVISIVLEVATMACSARSSSGSFGPAGNPGRRATKTCRSPPTAPFQSGVPLPVPVEHREAR